MEKLTGKQILEIVEENYSVESFGFDELTDTNTEIEFSAEENQKAEEIEKRRDDFYALMQEEIGSLSYTERKKHPKFLEYQGMPTRWEYERDLITNKLGLGKVVEIKQYGGEEMGSTWYSIKHFVDHDVYIKTDGYYQSYNGTDFHDGHGKEVKPVQKTVTVFE